MMAWKRLGEILVTSFGIAPQTIEEALSATAKSGKRLGEALLGAKAISEPQLAEALAAQQGLPCLTGIPGDTPAELLALIPIGYAKEYRIYPLGRDGGGLRLAMADPLDSRPLNDLAVLTGERIQITVAPATEIVAAINRGYEGRAEKKKEEKKTKERSEERRVG